MKTIKLDTKKIESNIVDKVAGSLLKGEVVAMPTDTVYSLHCMATDEKAVRKIQKIKGRPSNKAMVMIIKSYCMLHDYAKTSKKQEDYIRSIWPRTTREAHDFSKKSNKRPTTFVLEGRGKLAKSAMGKDKSVAFRLPKNKFLIEVLKKVNEPLVSSSCNTSGNEPIVNVGKINSIFTNIKPDIAVDSGPLTKKQASRIIDVRQMDNIILIRS